MPFIEFHLRKHRRRRRAPFGMPTHVADWFEVRKRTRRPPKDLEDGGVPVEPDKPKNLSGGAAAALEFDDEADANA